MHENTELLELSMSPQRMLLPPSCVLMTSLSNGFLVSSFLSPERKESTLGAGDYRFLSSLYRQPSSDSDPREKPFSKDNVGLWTFLHVPAHINTVGDFQTDWRKCNPIKSSKVNGNGKKHLSVPEVFLAASAVGQHRKFSPHARKT